MSENIKLSSVRACIKSMLSGIKGKHVLVKGEIIRVYTFDSILDIKNDYRLDDGIYNGTKLGLEVKLSDVESLQAVGYGNTSNTIIVDLDRLEYCLQFASQDETRLHFNGVAINKGALIATDGHCLQYSEVTKELEHIIIPRGAVKTIVQLCKAYKIKRVRLDYNSDEVLFKGEFFTFVCSTIRREFPKWQMVIPSRINNKIVIGNWINFKSLKESFNKSHGSIMRIKDGVVCLEIIGTCEIFDIGYCVDDKFSLDIGFNAKYLDKCIQGETVLGINDANIPVIFQHKFNGVIMPMRF